VIHESVDVVPTAARILAMGIGAAAVAAVAAFVYRWYSGGSIPEGVPVLLGVSIVATALNTTATLQKSLVADQLVGGSAAGFTLAAFAAGAIAADAGRRFGERLASDLPQLDTVRTMESDVGSLVRAAGRVIRVRVPETIEDIDGYEPVSADVKADLAGTTFLFPRRMTVGELRERLVERLKRDYEVGHVDVELDDEGGVEYLALGRRLAGVGQTLAPGTVAVAIRADPAFTATPGDRVQIWQPPERDQVDAAGGDGTATEGGSATQGQDGVAAETHDGSTEHRKGPVEPHEGSTGQPQDEPGGDPRTAPGDQQPESGTVDASPSEPTQIATGELRAAVGDVVTVAVDDADADLLEDDVRYRLLTLPASVQTEREFASLLRNAEETMSSVAVVAGSDLDGQPVESIELTVAALQSNGDVTAIPAGDRILSAGETVYVVGRPEGIRKLEARAATSGPDSATSDERTEGPATPPNPDD